MCTVAANISETDEDAEGDPISFEVYGITHDNLPDDIYKVGKRGYPQYGFDHEAHHAATEVKHALEDQFDWAVEITGVAMG